MNRRGIIILLSLFLLPKLAFAADNAPLLQRVGEYGQEFSHIAASGSLEKLLLPGNKLAAELKPVIEELSDEDYAFVEKNMKGYVVNREEVIFVEPDARFFSELARQIGTAQDRLYFNFMVKVKPDGFWPVYITRQTDAGGCIDFENGLLSKLYQVGTDISSELSEYFLLQIKRTIDDIANQLITGTCACGGISSVRKELQTFLKLNPKAPIAEKIRTRLEIIMRGDHAIRENCIGGT